MGEIAEQMNDLTRIRDVFDKQGWYPARWSHHPKEIRDALKAMRYRPRIKSCWQNSQVFFLRCNLELQNPIAKNLFYCEGWIDTVGVPMEHAWLLYKDEILDLTLAENDRRKVVYIGCGLTYTVDEVLAHLRESKFYSPVDKRKLLSVSPFKEFIRK